jgi:membrane protein implicated in regulation of membrane protease activity
MDERTPTPSPAEVADTAGGLAAGLGVITITFFPFALPLLVLVIAPLAVLALAGLLLALPILLPLWLARRVLAARRRRPESRPSRVRHRHSGQLAQ